MILPTILITGGAGYIGSHTALFMAQKGYKVIILDDFYHGQKFDHNWANVIKSDFADINVLNEIFTQYSIEAVMHFAGFIEVEESVKDPLKFYKNNVSKTLSLIDTMLEHNIKKFIFSSSCAVYGIPESLPLTEDHPKNPISPYGKTKLMVENFLQDISNSKNFRFVSLRFFNAAGALPEYKLGEKHSPETHIIPLLFEAIRTNKLFTIFGIDHPTKDGSCIRDYLHVWDIAEAHWKALCYLNEDNASNFFNLGTGKGVSVKEMICAVENVCKMQLKTIISDKRAGDPPILVADPIKTQTILKWAPKYSDLESILRSTYLFETSIKEIEYSQKK